MTMITHLTDSQWQLYIDNPTALFTPLSSKFECDNKTVAILT